MDPGGEERLKEKLWSYSVPDIFFLKKDWRDKISQKRYDLIQKEKGVNIQCVYDIFDHSKVLSIAPAEHGKDRYKVTLKHSKRYEIYVIIQFDFPNQGDLGVYTYVKCPC